MKEVGRKQGVVSPCAACKLLRRRCAQDCLFAPYFPADEPQKFANVHRIFGASNVSKLLQEVAAQHRGDTVSSLVYEANARVRDPVYGCVGAISSLHRQIHALQAQLAAVQAQMVHLRMNHAAYLAHIGDLGGGSPAAAPGTAGSTSSGSSFMSSPRYKQLIVEPLDSATPKSSYGLDMAAVLNQANVGEPSIWSC